MTYQNSGQVCEDCLGKGWLLFEDMEIQRCDQCQQYEGDLEAAAAFFREQAQKNSEGQEHYCLARIVVEGPFPAHTGKCPERKV